MNSKSAPTNPPESLLALARLAQQAGQAILAVKTRGVTHRGKSDGSPVTEADLAADRVIAAGLAQLFPGVPVVSEESVGQSHPLRDPDAGFILVDPLDGTREFIRGGHDYTVNIAVLDQRRPKSGVVHVPETGQSWIGQVGVGAWRCESDGVWHQIAARPTGVNVDKGAEEPQTGALVIACTRSHGNAETDAFLARQGDVTCLHVGSSLKFCLVAEGRADLYPRFGPTSEWDTAAGDAVLTAAGGTMVTLDRQPFLYAKQDSAFLNPGFYAAGQSATLDRVV